MTAIQLRSCPKTYTADQDKARNPADTIALVRQRASLFPGQIVAGTRRVDKGRLNIPVYMGICGPAARAIMPTRKQMGKGASPQQAEASALMELMERFAFFSFWQEERNMRAMRWSEAEKLFGPQLIPVEEILLSVHDSLDVSGARAILDTRAWKFYPATELLTGLTKWLPLDWFKTLGEFNGSSAGNTPEESLLQGLAELIERHVCALAEKTRAQLPTISQESCVDPALGELLKKFEAAGIRLILKDMSLGLPMPTVAALAWDPATFPASSEIVFTAGSASSPVKAAIRAVTEVAQLAGDFCSGACYEASGLPKYASLDEAAWLMEGSLVELSTLPSVEDPDILRELRKTLSGLRPLNVYGVETTHPALGIPAHYCICPGLEFRERDVNQSLGLFTGRKLAEEEDPETAFNGLSVIARQCPGAHYLPFFAGMTRLRQGELEEAARLFRKAAPLQPDDASRALAEFYEGHALAAGDAWLEARAPLARAVALAPQMKEYANLLGVAHFRAGAYEQAEACFDRALTIDRGSAMDLANRGLCRKKLGRLLEARTDLEAALELEPGLQFAREQLGDLPE